jgi:hypothetical protein
MHVASRSVPDLNGSFDHRPPEAYHNEVAHVFMAEHSSVVLALIVATAACSRAPIDTRPTPEGWTDSLRVAFTGAPAEAVLSWGSRATLLGPPAAKGTYHVEALFYTYATGVCSREQVERFYTSATGVFSRKHTIDRLLRVRSTMFRQRPVTVTTDDN